MDENELPTGPGYDTRGNWHGSATDEVLHWKGRALTAEAELRAAGTRRQTDYPIAIEGGHAVLRRG